ncbi:hypothetical protein [Leptospira sp. 'Mane']|uniref:hypothetical protein n=1 Tax=Leptospira sp. 'Mane' TaxID=3387407 RepID=UPI00398A8FEF
MVRCPACSHRFQFNPNDEKEIPGSFTEETTIPSFQFKSTNEEYINLIKDLLYAPIDFLKSKFEKKTNSKPGGDRPVFWKDPKFWIPILLFGILGLYLIRNLSWKPVEEAPTPVQQDSHASEPDSIKEPPVQQEEEETRPPSFEI